VFRLKIAYNKKSGPIKDIKKRNPKKKIIFSKTLLFYNLGTLSTQRK